MLRSLFSGVSGMKNNQTKMDVIGNNIANVNTTAFKSGRVRFQDIFSQTVKGASAPAAAGRGGINPRQIGLGVQVAAIDTVVTQGSLQPTGRPLDLGIENEGYFVLSGDGGTTKVYSRDGAFMLDSAFNIVNSDGYKLMGYSSATAPAADGSTVPAELLKIPEVNPSGGTGKLNNFSIAADGTVSGVYEGSATPVVLGKIALAKFANPAGLNKLGSNNFGVSDNSGPVKYYQADTNGAGKVQQGTLEMSNVDLAGEFTDMIITSRAFQANSRTITTSDEMLQELINLKR